MKRIVLALLVLLASAGVARAHYPVGPVVVLNYPGMTWGYPVYGTPVYLPRYYVAPRYYAAPPYYRPLAPRSTWPFRW